MFILNFTHPLTQDQVRQIEALTGEQVVEVRDIPVQFDNEQPFIPQAVALADACGLTAQEWQTIPLLIVPPALNFIAVALLAEVHGRMGYFSSCLRMRPVANVRPPRYEIAEVLDLQNVQDAARAKRQ
jgi:hypothetical protein